MMLQKNIKILCYLDISVSCVIKNNHTEHELCNIVFTKKHVVLRC